MATVWAGVHSGKRAHYCVVVDETGSVLLPTLVDNAEAGIYALIDRVNDLGDRVCWATDLNAGAAALLIAPRAARGEEVMYLPGRIVHHAAATYAGDAKDARMRSDLQPVQSQIKSPPTFACLRRGAPTSCTTGYARSTGYEPRFSSTSHLLNELSTTRSPRRPSSCSLATGPRKRCDE